MGLFNTKIEIKDFFVSVDIGCGIAVKSPIDVDDISSLSK